MPEASLRESRAAVQRLHCHGLHKHQLFAFLFLSFPCEKHSLPAGEAGNHLRVSKALRGLFDASNKENGALRPMSSAEAFLNTQVFRVCR